MKITYYTHRHQVNEHTKPWTQEQWGKNIYSGSTQNLNEPTRKSLGITDEQYEEIKKHPFVVVESE